ncbi:scarecrow-like protein 22 [Neltuma alba]|uniref:scarecrow-like protein 22 n=1 Tax=Neltuma alba TaxID=207710 RepID=UPI0010A58CFC|nr:scarecrow-like protein 22 [Prosopis alba]XP_028754140.1 scarecrow-like protein 22 [Prosopis alba]
MKAMPLPFEEFQGKGVFEFSPFASSDSFPPVLHHHHQPPPEKWTGGEKICYVGTEPTSVLDARRSPSPPTSSSTMASRGSNSAASKGGGDGSCSTNSTTTGAAATASENPSQAVLDTSSAEKCALPVEDWEGVLSESPGQDQSILRLIMGDIEDPSSGLNNILQSSGVGSQMVDFNGGFGVVDQGFELEPVTCGSMMSHNTTEPIFSASGTNPLMMSSSPMGFNSQPQVISTVEDKLNRNQVQFSENPSFFMPLTYPQLQDQQVFSQPQAKRLLCDTIGQGYQVPKGPLLDSGQELFARRQQLQLPANPQHVHQWQSLLEPPVKQQKVSSAGDDFTTQQLQQTIIDLIFKAAEHIEAGNPVNAQGILARLNHQLSPIGKPFQRAAFYMKEALELLLHSNGQSLLAFSPIGFIFKIGAYKSFSEISPVLQFANFTCNQALIEAVERFDRIHIIDFDIGFGVQWASFMQELALRNGGAPSLKVTAIVSPSTCDEIELSFTRESLKQYAKEINISFELNVMNIESLNSASWSLPGRFSDTEAIAVNLPVSCFSNYPSSLPLALCFVKQLMPKIVVTLDRNCDRIDVPFPHNLIHALQSYSALLESLDAVNVNLDVLQKIERHFVQPAIQKIILGRRHGREKLPPWKNMLLSSGFSPFSFSNSTEAQAECLVQRAPVRGFQVDRKHSSLTLCWQRKELVSISTWRC